MSLRSTQHQQEVYANKQQRCTSFFYKTLALYLSKLFAVYVLCQGAYWGAFGRNNPSPEVLQHDLRIHIIYSLGLLCDALFGIPSNFSALWPYWLILFTTFDFGPERQPISWGPLLFADRALSSLWQGAIVAPEMVYGYGGPFYHVIELVSFRRRCTISPRQP